MNQLDSIITNNKLDSIGLYEIRVIDWGKLWEVTIFRNSIKYEIALPNYSNPGLASLLAFINSIIPDSKKSRYSNL